MPPWLSFPLSFYLLLSAPAVLSDAPAAEQKASFIVLVRPQSKPYPFPTHRKWYSSLLSSSAADAGFPIIHTFETLLNGFSATLTAAQARRIKSFPGVLAVHPDSLLHPHTTRSPTFLGLDPPASRLSAASSGESGTVIGVIDTGIWPEHPSFSDLGFGPIPARWRGKCEEGDQFNRSSCNRKLIGARYFSAGYAASYPHSGSAAEFMSPRDSDGHGTHVASIAAGARAAGAGFEGFASGVARGMAPGARIAAYKVCWYAGCLLSDVVSAIERAVLDGVDVVSLSLGSSSPAPFYYLDPLAIATFRAALRGVFVAASAGNGGPYPGSVANSAPWITTVGAGTIDRDFPAFVLLGNRKRVRGISISITRFTTHRIPSARPLFSAGKITGAFITNLTALSIRGRIVLWEADRHVSRIEIGAALKRAGAAGMVVSHGDLDVDGIIAEPHVIPTVAVGATEAGTIEDYVKISEHPTAEILSYGTAVLPPGAAPVVASFSARGPNAAIWWALKPDLLAPGVSILGAWTGAVGPSGIDPDDRRTGFSVVSGTSMACPHVAGVAALMRAVRPGWGPWEVRSALMTTAAASGVRDESGGGEAGPFEMGAGQLWPERAWDPGLVYDLGYEDYVRFLCGLNYTDEEIRAVGGRGGRRCEPSDGEGVYGYNYPGFVVEEREVVESGEVVFRRRLKRVEGGRVCSYWAEVAAPEGYTAEVVPERLWFDGRAGEKLGFRLVLRRDKGRGERSDSDESRRERDWWVGGVLMWREQGGNHTVRSPIVVFSSKSMPS